MEELEIHAEIPALCGYLKHPSTRLAKEASMALSNLAAARDDYKVRRMRDLSLEVGLVFLPASMLEAVGNRDCRTLLYQRRCTATFAQHPCAHILRWMAAAEVPQKAAS